MKRVLFHSEAEWDLHQAIIFYERERPGLGRELRQEVEAVVRRIQQNPRAFPLQADKETRKGLVQRFPYTVVFIELEEVLWIGGMSASPGHPSLESPLPKRPEL
ncbi:MAG: type II toxin-antitoxin system RelE/ParE family toxin [Thermoanaerobaculia bacterium]